MAIKVRTFIALTGGTSGALDSLGAFEFADGDISRVITADGVYFFRWDSSSELAEDVPNIVRPDTGLTQYEAGRHVLLVSLLSGAYGVPGPQGPAGNVYTENVVNAELVAQATNVENAEVVNVASLDDLGVTASVSDINQLTGKVVLNLNDVQTFLNKTSGDGFRATNGPISAGSTHATVAKFNGVSGTNETYYLGGPYTDFVDTSAFIARAKNHASMPGAASIFVTNGISFVVALNALANGQIDIPVGLIIKGQAMQANGRDIDSVCVRRYVVSSGILVPEPTISEPSNTTIRALAAQSLVTGDEGILYWNIGLLKGGTGGRTVLFVASSNTNMRFNNFSTPSLTIFQGYLGASEDWYLSGSVRFNILQAGSFVFSLNGRSYSSNSTVIAGTTGLCLEMTKKV